VFVLTRLVSDPPMTFTPRPHFPRQTDIRVGRPGSTGCFDKSSCNAIVPQGNRACSGDKSGDVSDDSTVSSDNAGYFADGTVHSTHSKNRSNSISPKTYHIHLHVTRRFWHATHNCAICRHHPPQRAVLSQICCFEERKMVLFQILLDGAEKRDVFSSLPEWRLTGSSWHLRCRA